MKEVCNLCPRNCGAVRSDVSGSGFCGMGWYPSVARAALHFWEEPCISGTKGSGTVFFTGCTLQCVFCQNAVISNQDFVGKHLTASQLSALFFSLIEQGAHNINLVNPTHFLPVIVEALTQKPLPVPVVYNSSGYEKVESLRRLEGLVDIYLPDYKYATAEIARRYSHAPDYPEVAQAAIQEMLRQCGVPVFSEDELLQRGVLVRHLILPGHTKNSIQALKQLKEQFGSRLFLSLMAQYLPCGAVDETHFPEINRVITRREQEKVEQALFDLEIDGFVQDRVSAKDTYIPSFQLEGLQDF